MLNRIIITVVSLASVNSCSSIIHIPDSESTILKNTIQKYDTTTVSSEYFSVDDIRVSNYKFKNKKSDDYMYKVPYGNRNITITVEYNDDSSGYTFDNYGHLEEYFDFNVRLEPNNIYSIQTTLDNKNVTAWISDNRGKKISKKVTKELKYRSADIYPYQTFYNYPGFTYYYNYYY